MSFNFFFKMQQFRKVMAELSAGNNNNKDSLLYILFLLNLLDNIYTLYDLFIIFSTNNSHKM